MKLNYENMIREYKEYIKYVPPSHADDALIHCFEENKKAITKLIDVCGYLKDDPSGYAFHKAFRQTDVCNNTAQDLIIWHLISLSEYFFTLLKTWDEIEQWSLDVSKEE